VCEGGVLNSIPSWGDTDKSTVHPVFELVGWTGGPPEPTVSVSPGSQEPHNRKCNSQPENKIYPKYLSKVF